MAPPAVGTGTLRRLSELHTGGHPVLTVYLGLGGGTPSGTAVEACERELDGLTAELGRGAMQAELRSLHELLRCMPALAHGTRGLALFASARGAQAAAVPLPSPIEPMALSDSLPWLEPLAGIFTRGDRAVAVVDRHAARLFRGAPGTLVQYASVCEQGDSRPAAGACTGLEGSRPTREDPAEHAGRVAQLLLRAHRRRAFEELAVFAPSSLWPAIEAALHSDLRSRLSALVELELIDASVREIADALDRHAGGRHRAAPASSSSTRPPMRGVVSTARHSPILALPEPALAHAVSGSGG